MQGNLAFHRESTLACKLPDSQQKVNTHKENQIQQVHRVVKPDHV